jgi:hypothetical protein
MKGEGKIENILIELAHCSCVSTCARDDVVVFGVDKVRGGVEGRVEQLAALASIEFDGFAHIDSAVGAFVLPSGVN